MQLKHEALNLVAKLEARASALDAVRWERGIYNTRIVDACDLLRAAAKFIREQQA